MGKQLIKLMYEGSFDQRSQLFGLYTGQTRSRDYIHNGGWYNADGEKLSWGDLSLDDFRRIMAELVEGELFVILHEGDSFWNFVTKIGPIGSMSEVTPDVNSPGSEYIAEHACYIIVKDEVFTINMFGNRKPPVEYVERDGLRMKTLSRDEAREMIFAARTPKPEFRPAE